MNHPMTLRLFAFLILVLPSVSSAYNAQKCFGFRTKHAWLRKYDYKYFGDSSMTWKACTQDGITKFSTEQSSQTCTITTDPGVTTTGNSIGGLQCISSWGECSAIGATQRLQEREGFIAANLPEIKEEIALGKGDYLSVLTFLSACNDGSEQVFADEMQKQYGSLRYLKHENGAFSQAIDGVIRSHPQLSQTCL